MTELCIFYVKRERINQAYKDTHKEENPAGQLDEYSSRFERKKGDSQSSRNRSFSSFLCQQEAYTGFESLNLSMNQNNKSVASISNQKGAGTRGNSVVVNNNTSLSGISNMSLSNFCTVNELEKSMSYIEKTAKKLLPILLEVKKRMIPEKKNVAKKGAPADGKKADSDDDELIIDLTKPKDKKNKKTSPYDLKNILGYLNQGENLQSLSIGGIMQLQPFRLRDMVEEGKNELEITRESFINKITHMAVAYFCYSTEIRFILQMKEDPTYDVAEKQKESEFWHAKSLEMACSFLPGECPLLNHINLSYQKHFAPVKQVIKEDEEEDDNLIVIKPLNGIENQKFHPIIKNMDEVDVSITPYAITPINALTKPFISQFKSFNEYNESQKSHSNSMNNLAKHNKSVKAANAAKGFSKSFNT